MAAPASKRPSARQRGYNHKWEKARRVFLAKHPLCRMCEPAGHITAATVVDHITPHKGDPALFWDEANWQPLCREHHDRDKQSMERGGNPRQAIGVDGWPLA